MIVGIWRAARRVQRLVTLAALGPGPRESVVLADGEVLVGAAGLRRPQVVVSAGALMTLDDEELAASLEHEHGHIAHRHRYVLVAAELCRAVARFLPRTRRAARELLFHLERDADCYAVMRTHDPTALASAICKAAQASPLGAPLLSPGGGAVTRRIGLLIDEQDSRPPELRLRLLAVGMVTLVLLGALSLPAAAHDGVHGATATTQPVHADCRH